MTTYYVSNTLGDDSRTSTQAQDRLTPWKNHPWGSNASGGSAAKSLSAGDVVKMMRGDTWYDCQLTSDNAGASGTPIITMADDDWGQDDVTIIGGVDPSSLSWTSVGGGIFSCPYTTHPYVFVISGTHLVEDTVTPTTPTAGKYGWSSNVIYCNIDGYSDPRDGVLYIGKRDYLISAATSYVEFYNIIAKCGNLNNSALGVVQQLSKDGVVFSGIVLEWFKYYGIYQFSGAGGKVLNCDVSNGFLGTQAIRFASAVVNAECGYNTVHNMPGDIYSTTGYGISIDNVSSGRIHHNNVHDCLGFGIAVVNNASSNIIEHNIFDDNNKSGQYYPNGSGIGLSIGKTAACAASNNIARFNTFKRNRQHITIFAGAGTGGNQIVSNNLELAYLNGIKITTDPGVDHNIVAGNLIIHNPSPLNSAPYTGHAIESSGKKVKILNNVMVNLGGAETSECLAFDPANARVDVQIDNNVYYCPNGGSFLQINGSRYTTFAAAKAVLVSDPKITGLDGVSANADSHSIGSDPILTADYHLQPTSPCIGAGTAITGITTDTEGNQLYPPYNIGPYGAAAGALEASPTANPGQAKLNITPISNPDDTALTPTHNYSLADSHKIRTALGWTWGVDHWAYTDTGVPKTITGAIILANGIGPNIWANSDRVTILA